MTCSAANTVYSCMVSLNHMYARLTSAVHSDAANLTNSEQGSGLYEALQYKAHVVLARCIV